MPMKKNPTILLIDDDEEFLELFGPMAAEHETEVITMKSPKKAIETVMKKGVDVVVSDIMMPEMSGLELFQKLQAACPDVPVILITAFGSTEQAIQAVKQGAFHYFEKPIFDKKDLFWTAVREAVAKREMQMEISTLQREKILQNRASVPIVGKSAGIRKVLRSIKEVASLPVTVLIRGETGTGKELVARAIHEASDRRDKPFIAVSCSELSSGVLESELFGHEKGAFSGATGSRKGLFEVVHGGTFFLDEISEASPALQSKLLRVVETKSFLRVGGTSTINSDFRLLVATNKNLEEEVIAGRFRHDLFYRLNIYVIDVPPLRRRKDDIPALADFYIKRFSEMFHRPISGISGNAMLALRQYHWPGNVRELVNVLERAVITCKEGKITIQNLPFTSEDYEDDSDLNLKNAERSFIEIALKQTRNNKTKAAKLLGIARKTLIEKIKSYRAEEAQE